MLCAGLLWSAVAVAQNLNPTVEVTNLYAREASGIEKPSQLREIPDSLTRFNLDFDYSVNETPYQGAYEFTPYLVQPKPSARPLTEGKLYLRLGAGYTLHPEFAAVWTPVRTRRFRLNVFGDHSSHIGNYHQIVLNTQGRFEPDGSARKGIRMRSAVGTDALFNWGGGILRADLQYNNLVATDISRGDAMHHVLRASARVQKVPGTGGIDYELGSKVAMIWAPFGLLQETHSVTDARMGARLFRRYFTLGLQMETLSQPEGGVCSFQLSLPRYTHSGKRFSFSAGLKAAFMVRSVSTFIPTREGYIFPDVQASLALIPDYLSLYAAVTGGNELASYDTLLGADPFIAWADWYSDVKKQRILASLGLRGNIGKRFYYDVKGGYSWLESTWLWGYNPGTYVPAVGYAGPIHALFAVAEAGWRNHFLNVEGYVKYLYTLNTPSILTTGVALFQPAPLSARGKVFYNWGHRLSAGLTLEARSEMESRLGRLPGYLDLGMEASFQMSSRTGLWLKLGNLLNQPIQRVPFYAEKGMYFTAGISYNL